MLKKYNVVTNIDIEYTKANMSLEEAKRKHPDSIAILESGSVLLAQNEPLTIDDIIKIKKDGLIYSFGFGPAYLTVPFNKLSFLKVEFLDI